MVCFRLCPPRHHDFVLCLFDLLSSETFPDALENVLSSRIDNAAIVMNRKARATINFINKTLDELQSVYKNEKYDTDHFPLFSFDFFHVLISITPLLIPFFLFYFLS